VNPRTVISYYTNNKLSSVAGLLCYWLWYSTVIPSLLPAMQADLSDLDAMTATVTLSFVRSLGSIWGSTISSTTLNKHLAGHISDLVIRALLVGGRACSHATSTFINLLSGTTRTEVI
jgi:hypothetical protein